MLLTWGVSKWLFCYCDRHNKVYLDGPPVFPNYNSTGVSQYGMIMTRVAYPGGRSACLSSVRGVEVFAEEEEAVLLAALTGVGLEEEAGSAELDRRVREVLEPLMLLFRAGARVLVPLRIGALTLVEMFKISLPCTVSFPLDFFKSSVSISSM